MRTFYLQNALGQKWNLNNRNSFLHDVKGLGQAHATSYTQIGNRFLEKKNSLSQKKISGKIRFRDYGEFNRFSGFVQHKPLTLIYGGMLSKEDWYPPMYPGDRSYLLDVAMTSMEKSELETGGLYSKITLESIGTYYRMIHVASDASEIIIESDTVLECGIRIKIPGPCINPSYTHCLNGISKCSGLFKCVIGEGNTMVIDTTKLPFEIKEYSAEGQIIRNLYGTSDFSTKRFVMLGYGTNKITFTHEGAGEIAASVEAKMEYESV